MSTGKQHTNGRGSRDSATIDIDHLLPHSRTDVPPPAYSTTPERVPGGVADEERVPLLRDAPSRRVATPAETAARRATESDSRRRGGDGVGCLEGLRQRADDLGRRLGWWWDDKWHGMKGWYHKYKVLLVAAVVGIALLWGLIHVVERLSYECKIPEDAQVTTMEYSFDPADYREFFFHLDEGITGDISVSQSKDRIESNVTILITAQGSTPEMLSAISLNTIPSRRSSFLETNIFLNMKSSEVRAALSRNCTRVEVDIIFPRRLLDYDLIQLESNYAGNVIVAMDPKGAASIERLEISTKSGSTLVKDVSVTEAMNVVTKGGEGKVEAQVDAAKVIRVQAKKDVSLTLESWTNALDLKVDTSSNAQVTMKTPFYGHFWLKTTSYFSSPEFFASTCCYYERMRDNNTIIGYMSYNGYEPGYLPRIDIKGYTTRLDLLV
ncbi:hypothetical protein BG015_002890 [Linnemannia schmuckeri]|uniref:Adhesin domain-containing protein n=1 Tax=Linnemannia schmuckeri TaxID=64567 RepID=A0A9P5S5G2_9FUNG|nr:hypothetical protein BG015_002890 [Linnemannia schmuckeri]